MFEIEARVWEWKEDPKQGYFADFFIVIFF
jgi:hypothetical protein